MLATPPRARFLAVAFGCVWFMLFLSACTGLRQGAQEEDEEIPDVFIEFNPNIRIGEITWVNNREDYVVVRMDRPVDSFEPTFFLAMDSSGEEIIGYLLGGGIVEGQSFGARVLEGTVSEYGEVRIPGQQWTDFLFQRFRGRGLFPE